MCVLTFLASRWTTVAPKQEDYERLADWLDDHGRGLARLGLARETA